MSDTPKDRSCENTAPSPKNSHESKVQVFRYMAILFAAAFLLLLLAFLMQNRASQEAISDLTESVSSVHNVVEENAELRQQIEALEAEAEKMNEEYLRVVEQAQSYIYRSLHTRDEPEALDCFWQLNEAYLRGQYTLCRELIEKLEGPKEWSDEPLHTYLYTNNHYNSDKISMAERYQQIRDALD